MHDERDAEGVDAMTPTPPIATRAARLVTYANGAAARHKPSAHKRREAQKLVGLALLIENRKRGFSYSRDMENALRNT